MFAPIDFLLNEIVGVEAKSSSCNGSIPADILRSCELKP